MSGCRRYPCAQDGGGRGTSYDSYMRLCADAGITPRFLHEANPLPLIIGLVAPVSGLRSSRPRSATCSGRTSSIARCGRSRPKWSWPPPGGRTSRRPSCTRSSGSARGRWLPTANRSPSAPGIGAVPPATGEDDCRGRCGPHLAPCFLAAARGLIDMRLPTAVGSRPVGSRRRPSGVGRVRHRSADAWLPRPPGVDRSHARPPVA